MTPASRPLQRLRRLERIERVVDLVIAGTALVVLAVPIALLALLVRLTSPGPSFFMQRRVGRHGRVFRIVKLRTMRRDGPSDGPQVTGGADGRLTPLGRLLRKWKLDELTQLWNVLRGDMSLVGPRPEVERYVACFPDEFSVLHLVRPGMTSEASLRFRNEAARLDPEDPEGSYIEKVLPEKLKIEREWLERRCLLSDLEIVLRTLLILGGLRRSEAPLRLTLGRRGWQTLKVAVDLFVALAAWVGATVLRFDGLPAGQDLVRLELLALPVALAIVASLYAGGLIQGIWRFFSSRDAVHLVVWGLPPAGALALLRAHAPDFLGIVRTPYSIIVMTYLLAVAGQCGVRLAWTRWTALRHRMARVEDGRLSGRVVIFGAGNTGRRLLTELRRAAGRSVEVLAFFDDDSFKRGRRLGGVPVVGGARELPAFLELHHPDRLLVAVQDASESRMRFLTEHARLAGVEVKIVPSLVERLARPLGARAWRDLAIDDLIGRPPVHLDPEDPRISAAYRDKTVLVTGAAGSIGSELVRHLLALGPRRVVLFDKDENMLFRLDRELCARDGVNRHAPVVGDVRDRAHMAGVFRRFRPQVVVHAAAYKHVPMMEANELEAIANNVLGTRVLVRLAAAAGVESFVFISTDKAVRPSSVMGATKRLGELMVRAMAGRPQCPIRFSVVRFGNVLGSQGSVVETFLQQIRAGGPVTVTHPEMERYFLAIPEAVQLVLVAGALGEPEGSYVLEMGSPRRIVDLARDMIRLHAAEPGQHVPIVYSGLRPGEKLTEELAVSGRLEPVAGRAGLAVDREPAPLPAAVQAHVHALRRAWRRRDREEVRRLLRSPLVGLQEHSSIGGRIEFKPLAASHVPDEPARRSAG